MRFEGFVEKVARDVDEYVMENVRGDPEELYEACLHLIKAGGKRMRPAILVASGMVFGGEYRNLIPFAAAVELVHTFTLVHDDIMDNDDFRRGVPTVHKLWGVPMAILAGDLLFSKAFELASQHVVKNMRGCYLRGAKALYMLAKATSTVAEGQAMDMAFEKREKVSEKEYLEMIYKKTAALIEASAMIGALVAGAARKDVERMGRYGRNIGMAFQIKDDVLGVYGDEKVTGKPVYSDLREGKKTIMVIRALERGDKKLREKVMKVLGNKSVDKEEYAEAARMIEEAGVRSSVELEAYRLVNEAIRELEELESAVNKEYVELLKEIALYAVSREK